MAKGEKKMVEEVVGAVFEAVHGATKVDDQAMGMVENVATEVLQAGKAVETNADGGAVREGVGATELVHAAAIAAATAGDHVAHGKLHDIVIRLYGLGEAINEAGRHVKGDVADLFNHFKAIL